MRPQLVGHLITKVYSDGMRVAPIAAEVVAWAAAAESKERQRRERIMSGDDRHVPVDAAITLVRLSWNHGVIDVSSSFVASPGASATGMQEIDTESEMAAALATEQSA